ncbi:MAG: class B sortase [Ruminococcus sp.]|nr:class B sortase [Ruminococcus sp.]
MKWLYRIADIANTLLMSVVVLVSVTLMLCGVYVLNDIYYTNRTAFVSYDLLKYRPVPHDSSSKEVETLSELKKVNDDAVGWIEMFGTNINYPIVQGKDDLEYLNKDIFGYSTLSGSIYLAAENESNFNDWYNMIYGHHMDNGAMFGDIEKYLDKDYFAAHSEGILQTEKGDYSIKVIACIRTNAYEDVVYNVQNSAMQQYPLLYEYINEHAENQTDLPETLDGVQILGLSTCSDAITNGRIVLFASVTPWDEPTDGNATVRIAESKKTPDKEKIPLKLIAIGHKVGNGKWAILNLLCVCCTFLTLLPLWSLKRKYGQFSYSKRKINELEKNGIAEDKVLSDLKHFVKKGRAGVISEILILIVSGLVFILTEDLQGRMCIRDKWTGVMIIISASALTADYIFMRYRGKRPE